MILVELVQTIMKDIQVAVSFWAQEIYSKARSYETIPLSEAIRKASEELLPSIKASLVAGWSEEESKEILRLLI